MSTMSAALQTKTVILAAEARLQRSLFPELRLVFCTFHHGILTLTGRVSSRDLLQVAPTIVEGLHGVEEIDNQLVVISPDFPAGPESSDDNRAPGCEVPILLLADCPDHVVRRV